MKFNLIEYLERQRAWSVKTFGPGSNRASILDHLRKELVEVEEAKIGELEEWIDIIILALDGAWRAGYDSWQIVHMLQFKQDKNFARIWPDWRAAQPGKAIEHVRDSDQGWEERKMAVAAKMAADRIK